MSVSPGTLNNKRHWLTSDQSVTQQVCEVRLGAAGQIRTASGETFAVIKRLTSIEVSRGADGHTTVCDTIATGGRCPSTG